MRIKDMAERLNGALKRSGTGMSILLLEGSGHRLLHLEDREGNAYDCSSESSEETLSSIERGEFRVSDETLIESDAELLGVLMEIVMGDLPARLRIKRGEEGYLTVRESLDCVKEAGALMAKISRAGEYAKSAERDGKSKEEER